jgi:hypothetical protein
MADDLGWSDIGCYGGEIETPHLDSLAKDGLRFTQFYNNAICGPTRASLLTGLYCQQIGHRGDRWNESKDFNKCVTIGEMLQQAGYQTMMVGKWQGRDSALVRGLKNDAWSHVVLVSLLPARGAETPAVTGFEAGETVFRHRGGKVVASEFGELKKLGCQFHANGVRTMILIIGFATTVAKESGHRIGAARLERTTQNIERCVGGDSCNHLMSSTELVICSARFLNGVPLKAIVCQRTSLSACVEIWSPPSSRRRRQTCEMDNHPA